MKNINFAQTFKPEKQYISSLLKITLINEVMTAKEVSLATGIPMGERSGKVIPHIEYSKYMGLLDYEKIDGNTFKLSLTSLGNIVLEEDPGLKEELTLVLLHSMLTRNGAGAPLWGVMFQTVFPKYHGSIIVEDAIKELNLIYDNKVTRKNFSPFLNSYEDLFAPLDFINFKDEQIKLSYSQKIDKDFLYLYAFILFSYWDELYPNRIEITAEEFASLKYGIRLNMDSQTEYAVLDFLNEKGLIRLNRQLNPYTILKSSAKDELIKKLYSELF
ncbi:MAG: hypothetical protein SPJ89_10385 [Treponema sp.]|nr:hypothetical protein [Spirochaetia bacterium]MDD7459174.1 hypothetical protein [Spirochaetales bacterium]MDD7610115.1 hypothetical protein [Spirochaetales bacterium]MDY5812375.1 hypothetical protein [Treponema sp.]MDY5913999.1 hypothetical protein [Treponema sp.]